MNSKSKDDTNQNGKSVNSSTKSEIDRRIATAREAATSSASKSGEQMSLYLATSNTRY